MSWLFEWVAGNWIHDPAWVQIYWNGASVILSVITLFVLFLYALDTHKLANASVEQVKNAQMPFLALVKVMKDADPMKAQMGVLFSQPYAAWAVQNQGNAAAVNIRVRFESAEGVKSNSNPFSESLNPIPVGASAFIRVHPAAHITDCMIDYSSLDGRKFRTEITTVNSEHHLEFRRF